LRHLDEQQINIYVNYESSEPVSFKRFKEIWEDVLGVKHKQHYDLYKNGVAIVDDDVEISENIYNDYEVTVNLNIKEAMLSYKKVTSRII
jgi:hypothetical protein